MRYYCVVDFSVIDYGRLFYFLLFSVTKSRGVTNSTGRQHEHPFLYIFIF